ncbi:MAG: SDR family NAD(P)-dependent oxidoreductase [Granulosicoccaceae bacterium]
MKLGQRDIEALSDRFRVLFINSLSGFKSANLVGTVGESGKSNLAIVSSVVHLGANPALVGMVMRPHTVPRGTLENILATGVYTLNHVHSGIIEQAHQSSARYPEGVSEFDQVGLQEQWDDGFAAPFVQESRIKLGIEFREKHAFDINRTTFVIGEIVSVELPEELLADDGFVSLEKAGTVAVSSLDSYHQTQILGHLSYAKPDKWVTRLSRPASQGQKPRGVLVVGASGGIGQALCKHLLDINPSLQLVRMARKLEKLLPLHGDVTDIALDLSCDDSIALAMQALSPDIHFDWIFVASGWLHDSDTNPEKTFKSLERDHLHYAFDVNAVGPALLLKQLLLRSDKKRTMTVGVFSARVGSISDNRLGGWHSYRSSKAALNMLLKNLAIECRNTGRPIKIVGLQPGTTDTALSAPFQKGLSEGQLNSPDYVAVQLIKVMDVLEPQDSGKLFDFEGLPFEP